VNSTIKMRGAGFIILPFLLVLVHGMELCFGEPQTESEVIFAGNEAAPSLADISKSISRLLSATGHNRSNGEKQSGTVIRTQGGGHLHADMEYYECVRTMDER
jgi:hypothetical protein